MDSKACKDPTDTENRLRWNVFTHQIQAQNPRCCCDAVVAKRGFATSECNISKDDHKVIRKNKKTHGTEQFSVFYPQSALQWSLFCLH